MALFPSTHHSTAQPPSFYLSPDLATMAGAATESHQWGGQCLSLPSAPSGGMGIGGSELGMHTPWHFKEGHGSHSPCPGMAAPQCIREATRQGLTSHPPIIWVRSTSQHRNFSPLEITPSVGQWKRGVRAQRFRLAAGRGGGTQQLPASTTFNS